MCSRYSKINIGDGMLGFMEHLRDLPSFRTWDYGEDALPKDLSLVLDMIGVGSCDFFL